MTAADLDLHRAELLAHCYRMLGSVAEAEDLVQETMLRAWRSLDRYDEQRASLRTWLYRIATNVCLTALEGRARRPLPSGIGPAGDDPGVPLRPSLDVPWLQPFPDELLGPEASAVRAGSLRLALVAAWQELPARQRAVLLLRDVLEFPAAEVARQLGMSAAAVNSALQRARATLAAFPPLEDEVKEPLDAVARATVERYLAAFAAADVDAMVALLAEEVVMEMPPVPLWLRGRAHYGAFMRRVFAMNGTAWSFVPTTANGQQAVAAYCSGELHTLQVFEVRDDGALARTVVFQDPAVFAAFELVSRGSPSG